MMGREVEVLRGSLVMVNAVQPGECSAFKVANVELAFITRMTYSVCTSCLTLNSH